MMGLLYDVDGRTISYHLKNVFADHELEENSYHLLEIIGLSGCQGERASRPFGH